MTISLAGLGQVASQTLGKGVHLAKHYAPEILTTVGVVGVVASAVLAAKATLKLEPVVDRLEDGLDLAKTQAAAAGETEKTKDVLYVYGRTVVDVVKLYGPSVSLGVGSIVCIVAAHGIMRRRNVALLAAYNVLEKSFSRYRDRVIEEFGADKDREYRMGFREEKVKNEETGKMEVITKLDPLAPSVYARWFDQVNSTRWEKRAEYNLVTLRCEQDYANDRLRARGYLFLNEVYERLGLEPSQAGQIVGWVISKDGGDNYVDFGMYDANNEGSRLFINGSAPGIFLDFNVDGVIIDKI